MNEFWKTVFSSIGLSVGTCAFLGWLCREWISARLHKSIQHEYDLKLEEFKSKTHYEYELKLESSKIDFQNRLNERQTCFNHWYEEKAIAIKEFYTSLSKLFSEFYECHTIEEAYTAGCDMPPEINLKDKEDLIYKLENDLFKDWLRLRLFWEDEDDSFVDVFFKKANSFVKTIVSKEEEMYSQQEKEQNDMLLKDMTQIMEMLRKQFRASLKLQNCNLGDHKVEMSPQDPVDPSLQNEVKS